MFHGFFIGGWAIAEGYSTPTHSQRHVFLSVFLSKTAPKSSKIDDFLRNRGTVARFSRSSAFDLIPFKNRSKMTDLVRFPVFPWGPPHEIVKKRKSGINRPLILAKLPEVYGFEG